MPWRNSGAVAWQPPTQAQRYTARLTRLATALPAALQGEHPCLERLQLRRGGKLASLRSAAALTCLRLRNTRLPACLGSLTQLRSLVVLGKAAAGGSRESGGHGAATLQPACQTLELQGPTHSCDSCALSTAFLAQVQPFSLLVQTLRDDRWEEEVEQELVGGGDPRLAPALRTLGALRHLDLRFPECAWDVAPPPR